MKTTESLSNALGIEYEKQPEILPPAKIEEPLVEVNYDQEEDYRLARRTFRDLINKGNSALEGITDLAKESESPRAYEVLATLMKTVADTTDQLFALQKKVKEVNKDDKARPQDEQRINVEKAVFVGSTADLLKKVKGNASD